jgi:hypothetical protein
VKEQIKQIAAFMGWTEHPTLGDAYVINNDKHRVTPYWEPIGNAAKISDFNYKQSWDWQIPVWGKVASATRDLATADNSGYVKEYHMRMLNRYESAVFTNKPEDGFNIIMDALQFMEHQKK